MNTRKYWKMVLRNAGAKTLSHIVQKLLGGMVISAIAIYVQYRLNIRSLSDTCKMLSSVSIGPVVVGAFFFIKNLIVEPALLYTEPPKRTPAQQHSYEQAKAALGELGSTAVLVLRHLRTLGELTFIALDQGSPGPPFTQSAPAEGMTLIDTCLCLEACASKSLVSRVYRRVGMSPSHSYQVTYIDYRIAEGMKDALDELLYTA